MKPPTVGGTSDEHAQLEALYGTWRLLSWIREVVGTGERSDIFGTSPHGFITYTRDGRMSFGCHRHDRLFKRGAYDIVWGHT